MRKRGDVFPFVVVVVEASCLRVNDWFFFFLATSVCLSSVFPLLKVIHTQSREVGRSENSGGGPSSNVVETSAPLVGIGLTDLPKSVGGGPITPPSYPPVPMVLQSHIKALYPLNAQISFVPMSIWAIINQETCQQ